MPITNLNWSTLVQPVVTMMQQFLKSGFGNLILKEKMRLPKMRRLPNSHVKLPCFFTADAAFPLTSNIMRPYPGQKLE
jgi:hypothetical protein